MRLIALRSFRNTDPERIKVKNPTHPHHVAKGDFFDIGAADFKDLPPEDQRLIHTLNLAGCLGDAGNPEAVKGILAEAEAEKKTEARRAATWQTVYFQ